MNATHRCSECGHEVDDNATPRSGSCAFGPNKGHIHRFYPTDWATNPNAPYNVAYRAGLRSSPCTVYARSSAVCSNGMRGCGSYHGR